MFIFRLKHLNLERLILDLSSQPCDRLDVICFLWAELGLGYWGDRNRHRLNGCRTDQQFLSFNARLIWVQRLVHCNVIT